MSPEKEKPGGSSLSLTTLVISSLSAVAAAIVVPMFWERGSLIATAITPIVVAVVSAALNRPATVITSVAPQVVPRRSGTGAAVRKHQPTGVGARGGGAEQVPPQRRDDPFGLYEVKRPARRFPLRLAIITGLIAAVIGAAVVTASELAVFGHQIGNSQRSTGLLGGKAEKRTATPTPTPTATGTATETATPEDGETPTPTPTATPSATESATPSATPTPSVAPQATATPAAPQTGAAPAPTGTP